MLARTRKFGFVSALTVLCAGLGITRPVVAQTLTFSKATLPVGNGPTCVVTADINGTGRADLVTANFSYVPYGCIGSYYGATGSNLTVWFNNGHGVFSSSATINIGAASLPPDLQPEPESVAAADLNGDGKLELIEANFYYNTMLVLTNNGKNVFAAATNVPPTGRGPVFVTTADVNGDGKPDIITVNNFDSNLSVLTNGGNLAFTASATLPAGSGPAWVAAADLTGDGKVDLVCANYGTCGDGNTLTVFTGDGQGGFTASATLTVGYGPTCVVAADINGDGKIDLISANQTSSSLSVLTNDGHGNFSLKATIPVYTPDCVVATNLSGGTNIDLACVNDGDGYYGTVTVLINDGHGNFGTNTVIPVGKLRNSYYPDTIAAADFNGDGKLDLVVANYGSDSLTVLTQTTVEKVPVVSITSPSNGASFLTSQGIEVKATVSGSVKQAELYVDGQVFENLVNPPYSFQIPAGSLLAGSHALQVVAVNNQNASGSSPVVTITVNTPGMVLIDFDALNTSAGAVGGTLLADYLAGYGVTAVNATVGAELEAVNTNSLTGSIQVEVPSAPNFFTQAGLDQPVGFALRFATNLESFGFTRAGLSAQSGLVSHPQWTARAFDSKGTELSSVSEGLIVSPSPVVERSFVLPGPGIASVRFDSDSQQTAAFSGVLLDDLVLNYGAVAPMLSVALSVASPATNDIVAPATLTLEAAVTDLLSSSYSVSFYAGASLLGTVTNSPYELTVPGVLPGTYLLQASVVDASGLAVQSPVVPITVQLGSGSRVVNFDAPLNASRGPVEGALLKSYLASNGVTIVSVSAGTQLAVESQQNIGGGSAVRAASAPDILTQIGSNGPVEFTLGFAPLLSQFGFTRPELLANPFVSHPGWQVTALDGAGNVVGQVAEGQIDSSTNVGAREFSLGGAGGPGIAEVEFSSQGTGLTTFNAMLVDDFVLTTNGAGFPPAVAILRPVSGQVLAAPPALKITAAASDAAGIASVSFYANGNLIGTATASPYSILWTNPPVGSHPLKAVASNVLGLTWTSAPVHIVIQPSAYQFGIASQPASQTIAAGGSVTFTVVTTGTNGVGYQWSFDGAPISGATSSTLVLAPPIADSNAGTYTVAATANGTTLVSSPAVLSVVDPPAFTIQPQGQTVGAGATVTMRAQATTGGGPLTWRWLLNGTVIPGATNRVYSIVAAQPHHSGNYQVVVANLAASALSATAPLIVETAAIPESNDDFANRASINPLLGPVSESNQFATLEPGEPLVGGRPGGKSIWFTWHAAFNGTLSLTTEGSDFETLLGVYTGTALRALKAVAADEDSGGYLTSLVTFNVKAGTDYQIVVDGFQGAFGRVVLGLPAGTGYRVLNPTSGDSVPVITRGPASQVVGPNATVVLSVLASSATRMTYQWSFEGAPITGATGSALVISHVQPGSVGVYDVLVANAAGSAQSEPANLQIGLNPGGLVHSTEPVFVDSSNPVSPAKLAYVLVPEDLGGDTRGFSVAQTFSTVGAAREPGEPDPCGQVGGASQWFVYTAPASGKMEINTEGSSFDTMLGVYEGSGSSFASLAEVGCGYTTNYVTDGQPSVVLPGVAEGTTYYILIDGYHGASGLVRLQIGLGQTLSFRSLPPSQVVTAGSNATLNVTAVGSTPFFYQWQLNGANVPGATTASCKITNAQEEAVGNYTVIVSNALGAVTSSPPAVVSLQYAPLILSGPSNQMVTLGQPARFTVTTLGVNVKTNRFVCQWYFEGILLPRATNLTFSLPVTHWTNNGAYSLVISNSYGAVTSAPAMLMVLDKTLPTIAIKTPANDFVSDTNMVLVTGTASDIVGVAHVRVEVGANGYQLANGSNSWSITITNLEPGANVISARSVDLAFNLSTVAKRTIIYKPPMPMAVQRKFRLIEPGNLFKSAAGTYSGLFYPAHGATQASSGFLTATLASRGDGTFSANLLLDGGSYPFTGKFDSSGGAQSLVPRAGKSAVTASLHLDLDRPDGQMTGALSDGEWRSILQAGRAATNPVPLLSGQFALVIPSGSNAPVGYLTLTQTAGATALVAGSLADGASLLRTAPMLNGAAIPLYAPLYSGKGLFLGWITLTNSGDAFWIKPGSPTPTGVLIVK